MLTGYNNVMTTYVLINVAAPCVSACDLAVIDVGERPPLASSMSAEPEGKTCCRYNPRRVKSSRAGKAGGRGERGAGSEEDEAG